MLLSGQSALVCQPVLSQLLCFFLFSASTGVFRFISHRFESLYDRLNGATRREQLEQLVVYLSAWGFLLHLFLIFLARTVPALGTGLLSGLDRNYLHAVYTPFSFILFYEVLLLVLAIPQSHTRFPSASSMKSFP